MRASSVKKPFNSPEWIFETKLDGFRAIAVIDSAGKARLWSRNQLPLEPKLPMVLDAVDQLELRSTILDGEIVTLDVFLTGLLPNQVIPYIGFHWTN
jgi:bifunctional non-homologous end joining protein LigD